MIFWAGGFPTTLGWKHRLSCDGVANPSQTNFREGRRTAYYREMRPCIWPSRWVLSSHLNRDATHCTSCGVSLSLADTRKPET